MRTHLGASAKGERLRTSVTSHNPEQSEFILPSSSEEYDDNYKWIARCQRVRFSENSNDNLFQKELMGRFYHKYSASQDYYFSNHVNCILSDAATPPVIRFQDIATTLDEDEYLKRFYRLEEYPNKIGLLSEYYKFHRDIARIFTQPVSHILNKYHDAKRKLDYQKIKQILAEEAAKKNKRVAMNEEDNEIRYEGSYADSPTATCRSRATTSPG